MYYFLIKGIFVFTLIIPGLIFAHCLSYLTTVLFYIDGQAPAAKQLYQAPNQAAVRSQDYNTHSLDTSVNNSAQSVPAQSAPAPSAGSSSAQDLNKQKKPCNCTKSQCLKL